MKHHAPVGTKFCQGCADKQLHPFKPFSEFNKKGSGLQSRCKECQRSGVKDHYDRHKVYYAEKRKRRQREIKQWLKQYRTTIKCSRCPEDHPVCMHFHHNDPNQKDFNLAEIYKHGWSITRILSEIAKCTILCANCHAKEHYGHLYEVPLVGIEPTTSSS